VRSHRAEVSREPRGNRCNIWLPSKRFDIGSVTILNGNIVTRSWCFIVTIVWPGLRLLATSTQDLEITHQPIQRSINLGKVCSLLGMEVGCKEYWNTSGRPHGIDIKLITSERGSECFPINKKLCWEGSILCDLLSNLRSLRRGVPPVEVEGYEDFHAVVGSRLVGVAELLVGIWVNSNVESECINAEGFCPLHVIVEVLRTNSLAYYPNLQRC
jgi:hypothetical protein